MNETQSSIHYLNNPNLKRAGVQWNFTNEQIIEFARCAADCQYFITNYMKIVHVDHGLIPFNLYPYQEKMVDTFVNNRFTICKLPRQSGKSSAVTGFMLWMILFHGYQSIAILANKAALAQELLSRITLAYEHLPLWLQQGVVSWNKRTIELENGSKIMAGSTTSSAVRGGSYNIIFLDEFAFIHQNMAEKFFASVYPTISSGQKTRCIIVSTPNGLNHFYKMWMAAKNGTSSYVPIEVNWNEIPGRDEAWKAQQIENTSPEQFSQEFEGNFIGSSNTLIAHWKLQQLAVHLPLITNDKLRIYEKPEKGGEYIICVDTAEGKDGDYSACSVVRIDSFPYKQVATYYDNQISVMMYPEVIYRLAQAYNEAFLLVESNDVGGQVANSLYYDFEYENMFQTNVKGKSGQRVGGGFSATSQIGVRNTTQFKRIGCANLKTLIESDKLIVNDKDTIFELASFVPQGQSFAAEPGHHDDLVMTLVMFGWLSTQAFFKDLTGKDIRKRLAEENENLMEQSFTPFGFVSDGDDEDERQIVKNPDPYGW